LINIYQYVRHTSYDFLIFFRRISNKKENEILEVSLAFFFFFLSYTAPFGIEHFNIIYSTFWTKNYNTENTF